MDNFTYNYKTGKPNQLDHVQDAVTSVTNGNDLKSQTAGNYVYNSIGQLTENKEEDIKYVYNAAGLVTEVIKNNVPLVKFFYNDKGHRVRKEVYVSGSLSKTEYYIRDAAGSVMAIYNGNAQKELPIYGASRLGIFFKDNNTSVYQLTDHLGNVRAVIAKEGSNAMAITSATDYYPFGMPMPNRQVVGGELYRYAFQGQEKDPETGKEAFRLRLWDSRIGRWLTTDPAGQYASPYLGMGNDPINGVDPDGAEYNPVYDENGNFLGTTKSGFTGEALIMNAADFKEEMSDKLAFSKGTFLSDFNFSSIVPRGLIETHIANYKLGDGLDISGTISIHPTGNKKGYLYTARYASKDNLHIFKGQNSDNYFEPTVENLRNLINVHEVEGHVLNGLSGENEDHILIYKSQINHKQFHSTTARFKRYVGLKYWYVGGDFNDSKKLTNFYFEYAKPIINRYQKWSKDNTDTIDYFSIFR